MSKRSIIWLAVALIATGMILALLNLRKHEAERGSKSRQPLVVEDSTPIAVNGITTEDVGIETRDGLIRPLIQRGTKVPCSIPMSWHTAGTQITMALYRGTNEIPSNDHLLGRYQVVGVPPAPRGLPQVEVTFAVTPTQILLSARDLTRKMDMEVRRVQ